MKYTTFFLQAFTPSGNRMGSLVNVFLSGRYKLITKIFFAMAVGAWFHAAYPVTPCGE
jgi:hypothetical protein